MAITNLQQARQMFRYGGDTMGGPNDKSNNNNNNGNGQDNRENYISKQYTNVQEPTVTLGVDKFDNPIEVKTTYKEKRARKQMLDALNKKGISSFDPRVTKKGFNVLDPNNLITNFASKQKKGLGIMDLVLMGASGGLLGAKAKTLGGLFSKGKFALDKSKQIGGLLETIGLTDKNVVDSFTSNFSDKFSGFGKGKKSTSTTKNTLTDNRGEREGLASIENQAAGYDEYILLLQKLQSGNISDSERNRFNVLKNMLGI